MKKEQLSGLDKELYDYLNSTINAHIEVLEMKYSQYSTEEIQSSLDRLVEWKLIYVVKELNGGLLYATEKNRHLQTPYP